MKAPIYLGLAFLCLIATAGNAADMCPGDLNGDMSVTVNEIITTVNAGLLGCSQVPQMQCEATVPETGCPLNFGQLSKGRYCVFAADAGGCRWGLSWDTVPAANGASGNAVRILAMNQYSGDSYLVIGAFSTSLSAGGVGVISDDAFSPLFVTSGGYISIDPNGYALHIDLGYDILNPSARLTRPRPSLAGCTLPGSFDASFFEFDTLD